ncbi:MAG TPA: hypothetical protein VJ842_08575 [Pyrinomonadaceae bacterium]|nr:hypothetical protein [Pyrinomonadaceae bacterium]
MSKEQIQLSESEARQPEGVTRKTEDGYIPLLKFNMPVSDKSSSINEGDDVRFRNFDYVVFEKRERRYPDVSEACDEFWLLLKSHVKQ